MQELKARRLVCLRAEYVCVEDELLFYISIAPSPPQSPQMGGLTETPKKPPERSSLYSPEWGLLSPDKRGSRRGSERGQGRFSGALKTLRQH